MKTEGQMKWYQCKKDFSITIIILLIFGIGILHFDISESFRKNVWHVLKLKLGINPNMVVDLFFEWGMWLSTIAVLIESILVCLKHYWSWLVVTLLGVSFFITIQYSNNLEGTMKITDILISEFSDIDSISHFIRNVFPYVLFSIPYVVLVSVIVFALRKKYNKYEV